MDKALKQRLVGATVLIILAVIVLPMLLSGRSETFKQESRQIEMPAKPDELSIETRRFPVGVPNRPQAPPREETVDAQADVSAEEVAVATALVTESVDSETPISAAPERESEAQPEPEMESPPPVTTISLPAAPEDTVDSTSAVNETEGAPRYLVQVASFSSEKRANTLSERLRSSGLQVLMDVVVRTGGRFHRVRVGPYAERADADAVIERLGDEMQDLELAPRILDLRPDDSAPVTTPSDPLIRWVVQVGSFGSSEKADALVASLRGSGLPAFSEQVTSASGTAYKVRIGPEISRESAVELMRKVRQDHGLNDSFVTTSE